MPAPGLWPIRAAARTATAQSRRERRTDRQGLRPSGVCGRYVEPPCAPGRREKDPNHLEVEVGWELYCADEAKFRCPHCGKKHPSPWDDGGVLDALEAARAGKPPELVCPTCDERVLVNDLEINPPGAAGPLAFRFMNWWPLRRSVIERMEQVAGTALCVVRM